MNPLGRPGLTRLVDLVYASVAVIYPEVVKLYRYSTELRVRIFNECSQARNWRLWRASYVSLGNASSLEQRRSH